ncbi:hypothetical protein [Chryseobacterium sp. EZn1]|uniref:hypothetical protein n=1 Tax=Chryseobacterium cupriresistens TaxID=3366770 RepID=UPI003984EDBD
MKKERILGYKFPILKPGIFTVAYRHLYVRHNTDHQATETTRPVLAVLLFDNLGSQKILEKCGFKKIGTDKGFANARQMEIEEFIYRLDQMVAH